MIKLKLGDRVIELVPDTEGVYRVPIAARYHPAIGEFQKANNEPNFTLDTILRNLGLVPVTHKPAGDYELWRRNAPTTQQASKPSTDSAARFNLSGDTFGSQR